MINESIIEKEETPTMKLYDELNNAELLDRFHNAISDGSGIHTIEEVYYLKRELLRRLNYPKASNTFQDDALLSYAVSAYLFTYTGTHPIDFALFADDIKRVFNIYDNAINRQVWMAVMRKAGRENELS
jgi:hypothetical protein